ncbi:uncharacterized protein [Elaeis guineensis]|uniref:Uncharacterized protein LOC105048176 n=1 Tax=Elaeis guineensis var. tenera TaxID=51953 RepID=A0A6I9RFB7_ELAGV|nr:uncharacterized protein LOC105048176 [Elaeis guineensis]
MGRSKGGATSRYRFPASDEAGGDHIECSGRSCRSCIAVLLADCIALGCCPCAVVSLLALALFKVPWVVGRRCLRSLKKRRGLMKKRVRDEGEGEHGGEMGRKRIEMDIMGMGLGDDRNMGSSDFGFGDERVWEELYEVGHWGFGRVSFSGLPGEGPLGKGDGICCSKCPCHFRCS